MEAGGLGHLPQLLQALHGGGQQRQAAVAAVEAAAGGQKEARDVLAVCERLPLVGVSWQVPQPAQGAAQQQEGSMGDGGSPASYTLEVALQRLGGKRGSQQSPPRVYAPRFPKARLGWSRSSERPQGLLAAPLWGARALLSTHRLASRCGMQSI